MCYTNCFGITAIVIHIPNIVYSHIWMLFTGTLSVQSKEVQMKEAIMLSLNHVPKKQYGRL